MDPANKSIFSYVTDISLYKRDEPPTIVPFLAFNNYTNTNSRSIDVENELKNIGRPYSKSYCTTLPAPK
jgi:hypothetical protein